MRAILITREGRVMLELLTEQPEGAPLTVEMYDHHPVTFNYSLAAPPENSADVCRRIFRYRGKDHGVHVYAEV